MEGFDLKKAGARPVKERSVESQTVTHAKKIGYFSAKVKFEGHKGASDRIFIGWGDVFFIEFKRPKGGKISGTQKVFRNVMASHGINVFFAKTAEEGKQIIDSRNRE